MKDVGGRIAIITGGGAGIGQATAVELARLGAICVIADLSKTRADAVVTEILAAGGTAESAPVDVADPDAVQELADQVARTHGQVDIVVNNAGIGMIPVATDEVPLETFRRILDVN